MLFARSPLRKRFALLATLLAFAATPAFSGSARNANPGVLPIQSSAHGGSYGDWSAAWQQWVLAIPTPSNPLLDATGQFAAQGQSGKVWFLAGDFNGGPPITRTITIPNGTSLFFPVFNFFWTNEPEFGDPSPWDADAIAFARGILDSLLGDTDNLELFASLDGQDVTNLFGYRAQDEESFQVDLPTDNILGANPGPHDAVIDGYYLFLTPLSPGHHTLHFVGDYFDGAVLQDITYVINVKAGK